MIHHDELHTFNFIEEENLPKFMEQSSTSTETIDIDNLVNPELTSSGSFYLTSVEYSALGKLLNALPIPALLIDESNSIIFANRVCGLPTRDFHNTDLQRPKFSDLFFIQTMDYPRKLS